ncbi:PREDICTED: integrator complex subunit 12-like [Dinoponera quadriceps]|uniref:Integrator complex subunit 12 n=1 Tax=Dinoponera quadriceps TaxID=609295 RepID=A0A6P3XWL4_DINQU|nr:PREDICTED: integrator complex subunit 12-like [Dinoponera quadriceps]
MHAENTSDIDQDFFNALALLHSTAENSTEKLRRLLDTCIEKKYGRGKTLAARMPKGFLQNVELRDNATPATRTSRKREYMQGRTMKRKFVDGSETVPFLEVDVAENNVNCRAVDVKVFEVAYEECSNDEDVPRISIPDEGLSADGTVCKICNGVKLGALILLECQECQEAYHPLCHQPPIVDVDVYDPRFIWRCRRCMETSSSSLLSATSSKVKTTENSSIGKARQTDSVIKKKENIQGSKMLEKKRVSPEKNGYL